MRRPSQPHSRDTKTAGIEWIGGMVTMPTYVTGEGEPYRPEMLLWMGADGSVLGSTAAKPGELLAMASESLLHTIEEPMCGRPHRPSRIRVASARLADVLQADYPGLDVVCAPTPELDEVLVQMQRMMDEAAATEQSYLWPDTGPDAIASLFKAAAALFRAKPWDQIPDDQSLISVMIESLGVRDAAMSVIGQMGESLGFILFSSLDDFDAYLDAADALERGELPKMPPHFTLNFERGANLAPALRKEVAEHGWEVAGANAYPWPVAIDEDLVARPPNANEVTMAEAIARALTRFIAEEHETLRTAWEGGEPISRTLSVRTYQGEINVTLRAPYTHAPIEFEPSYDILADLAQDAVDIDVPRRLALEDELIRRFAASPEAEGFDAFHACALVMDLGANYVGATIATLEPSDLREILFELIPRKISIEASEARGIVEQIRAFYRFLKRAFGLDQADACLHVLGGNAVAQLETALSDSDNFGVAKSLLIAGRDAGFDMQSREGVEAWMERIKGTSLDSYGLDMPRPSPSSKKADKAKKDKRKAAKKARKKNR